MSGCPDDCSVVSCQHVPVNMAGESITHMLRSLAFFAARLYAQRDLYRRAVSASLCLSVCLSVTFVYCVDTSKHILKRFFTISYTTILVFPYQTLWQYSRNRGIEFRCHIKNRDF